MLLEAQPQSPDFIPNFVLTVKIWIKAILFIFDLVCFTYKSKAGKQAFFVNKMISRLSRILTVDISLK